MDEPEVEQLGRSVARAQWGTGAFLVGIALVLVVWSERYIENALQGPFPVENRALAAAIRVPSAPRRYFFRVKPDRIVRTGIAWNVNGVDEADYLVVQVGRAALIAKVKSDFTGGTIDGFLDDFSTEEKTGVVGRVLARDPALKGRLLPFKLDGYFGFKANAYVLIVLAAVIALAGLWILLRATYALFTPEGHPYFRARREGLPIESLKWNEPAKYLRALARQQRGPPRWRSAHWAMGLITAGLFLLFRSVAFFRGEHPQVGLWGGMALAAGIGAAFAYLLPWIVTQATTEVWTNRRGLHRKGLAGPNRVRIESWPWEALAGYRFEAIDLNDGRYGTLVLRLRDGATVRLGLDGRYSREQIGEFLGSKGLSQDG